MPHAHPMGHHHTHAMYQLDLQNRMLAQGGGMLGQGGGVLGQGYDLQGGLHPSHPLHPGHMQALPGGPGGQDSLLPDESVCDVAAHDST